MNTSMSGLGSLATILSLVWTVQVGGATGAQPGVASPRARGTATVEITRPAHFPHRIWAACDFECRLPDYGWFGPAQTNHIPRYPGNATALGVSERPYRDFSALMTGINPVPGPRMGKANHLYLRYYLVGGTEATFQHFSLTTCSSLSSRTDPRRWIY